MARYGRKPRFIKYERLYPGSRRERIIIPQPPDRPIHLRGRDQIDREFTSGDTHWFILHRRGIRRTKAGQDPLEARAVSKSTVKGTLPERIVYMALIHLRMSPTGDFDFQSSLDGGRLELGGIVADFLFHNLKFVIQVQGPTHREYLRRMKDQEQENLLAAMGFRVFYLTQEEIYDEYRMWDKLRQIFNLGPTGGGGGAFGDTMYSQDDEMGIDPAVLSEIEGHLAYSLDVIGSIA